MPYKNSTQVSIYTGTKPVYREAIRFTTDKIYPYNAIETAFNLISTAVISGSSISGTAIYGTTITAGAFVGGTYSGTTLGATSYAVGSKVLGYSEFTNLDGQDQGVRTTDSPTFVRVTSTVASGTSPFVVTSPTVVTNLNADMVDAHHAPVGNIVGDTDTQTLTNKTLTTPTIASFVSGTHDHTNAAGGGVPGGILGDLQNLTQTASRIPYFDTATTASMLIFENVASGSALGVPNSQSVLNYVDPFVLNGSANKTFVPLMMEWGTNLKVAAFFITEYTSIAIQSTGGEVVYRLPMPTSLPNGKKLYVDAVKFEAWRNSWNVANYIDTEYVSAIKQGGGATIHSSTTNIESDPTTRTFTAFDCSTYTSIHVYIDVVCNGDFFVIPSLRVWYAD